VYKVDKTLIIQCCL